MNLDISTTNVCNLGCTYCSEGHYSQELIEERNLKGKTKVSPKEIRRIFDEKGDAHNIISFWGGEPLMNFDFIRDTISEFLHDNVTFFFYTNGIFIKKYIDILDGLNRDLGELPPYLVQGIPPQRLFIQISYDGNPIHDRTRVKKNGKGTSEEVKEAIKLLQDRGIAYSLKSTICPRDFKDMYKAFLDVISLGSSYFPTPDLTNTSVTPEELRDLRLNLALIAKTIKDNGYPHEIFKWFSDSKAKCSAGINYFAVNTNKDIVVCHGALYGTDHIISRVDDVFATKKLSDFSKKQRYDLDRAYQECDNCGVRFCMKCQFANYNLNTQIKDKKERWYSLNHGMCKIWEVNSKVYSALLLSLRYHQEL